MADKHHWGDSGILRGKKPEEDDLLVFGYSCKLFRDDEKALFIDQGKHLIPWMGDETLKIDRYDGRAALPDLRQFEAGLDFDFMAGLSEAERRVETLCDEERYRALHHAEDDEELYHEEELKRLQQALAGQHKQYGAVHFAYDEESQRTVQVEPGSSSKDDDDEDTPFVAPPELDIPLNMALPPSNKLHAIIERTAGFIAKQGGQMEVLLKAKQSGNAQFGFLSYDHDLHPYYKLLLAAIRAGRYKLREPQNNDEEEDGEEDDEDEHYLHPSLASSTKIDLAPAIPSITYRPSANCAYSMLVTKIKGKQAAMPPQEQPPVPILPVASMEQLAPVVPMPVIPQVPILQPPQDLQLVIDKMAAYVAKNGPEFEDVVRNKGDPRFSFLDPTHIYHPYYRERMRDLSGNRAGDHGRSVPTPVSFSIRPQAGDGMLETRSALEESGERPRPGEAYMATALQSVADVPLPTVPPPEPENLDKDEQERRQAAIQRSKIAEERLRAKLMAAARERMASASKEKQVQQERKRKVAAFLSRLALEKRQIIKPEPPVIIGPQLPPELQPPPEADQDEVRSIPSPSPPSSPSPPPPPSMSITPPPPPTIGSQPDLVPIPRKPTSPRSNGDRKRHRSKSPASQVSSSSSRKHKHHHKHSSNPKHHRRHRSRSPSSSSSSHRKQRRRSPSPRKSHKKRSRNSPSPSPPRKSIKEKRKARSSSSDSVVSASSSSSSSSA